MVRMSLLAGGLTLALVSSAHADAYTRDAALLSKDARRPMRVGVPSPVLTSTAPSHAWHGDAPDEPLDTGWLEGLAPPDIPVRWNAKLVRLLERYRDDDRRREVVRALLSRARRYAPMIREVLDRHELPRDLLFVAMVESGFDPTARSGAGAVGLWQFMPVTADDYGLERSRWVDQRMNPERSTEAAARLLGDLHARFGTWELAVAAFNMGYGALTRSIQKYNTNDFWLLSRLEAGLPYETIDYVTKVMAFAVIGRNPERFGVSDADLEHPRPVSVAHVPGGVWLGQLARAAGLSREELARLNPELRRERTPPHVERWPLRIYEDLHVDFARRWTKMQPNRPALRQYTVRFGERLEDVAELFSVSARRLARINGLADDARLEPGRQLLVPAVEPELVAPEQPEVVAVPRHGFELPERKRVFYRVTSDDTVQRIADFFGVQVDDMRRWNAVDPDAELIEGMVLQLFVPADFDLSTAKVLTNEQVRLLPMPSEAFFDYYEAQRDRVRIRYRVRDGDTMSSLARRFELSVGSIARINQVSRYSELKSDQELIIYAPEEVAARMGHRRRSSSPGDDEQPAKAP